jgi:hypothetical protein
MSSTPAAVGACSSRAEPGGDFTKRRPSRVAPMKHMLLWGRMLYKAAIPSSRATFSAYRIAVQEISHVG